MEYINSHRNFNKGNPTKKYSPYSYEDKSLKKENLNFNLYNISPQKNPNSRLVNIRPIINQKLNNNKSINHHLHCCQCVNSHYHVHHFCIPHNYNNHICPRLNKIQKSNDDLLNEIADLKQECQKFKDELEKTKSENEIGNKYIKLLENKINLKEYNINNKEDNIQNKYHSMLDKSFEVLNSVSNKCDNDKAKLKGNVMYYAQKEPDYDTLIEAQKRWLDNLPEKYINYNKNNNINNNNSTFSNTKDNFGDIDIDNTHYNEKYFNNMRNFNKTSENNNIKNNNINKDIYIKNNPKTYPEFNFDNNEFNYENKEPDLEEQIPQDVFENEKEEEEENNNPINERYLIIDSKGNPIIIGGNILLGMKLIPLIGEDGKEELDENGNIILIGPDGKPKSQDELEPILLDNDKPLVNEENRPILGLNGIPLINDYGNFILGPGELYDRNNNLVKGVLGLLDKDNYGNPKKYLDNIQNIEQPEEEINNNNEEINENNNIENNNIEKNNNIDNNNIENDNYNEEINDDLDNNNINNNENNNEEIDYEKLRPLIGSNGLPVRDSKNNFIFLDENNKPIKNTGINLLLDQNGKPVLNSQLKPILINQEGKPINLKDNEKNDNIDNNKFINSMLNIPENNNNNNIKGYIKYSRPKSKKSESKKNKNNNRYNRILINEEHNIRDKRNKGQYTYSEVSSDEIKKIRFMNNSARYKGNCFACEVGCSVSRSGYSPMNYVPYNNMIRRREETPLNKDRRNIYNDEYNNIRVNKTDVNNDNNYYLTEE